MLNQFQYPFETNESFEFAQERSRKARSKTSKSEVKFLPGRMRSYGRNHSNPRRRKVSLFRQAKNAKAPLVGPFSTPSMCSHHRLLMLDHSPGVSGLASSLPTPCRSASERTKSAGPGTHSARRRRNTPYRRGRTPSAPRQSASARKRTAPPRKFASPPARTGRPSPRTLPTPPLPPL
jgi:hypothetical protein